MSNSYRRWLSVGCLGAIGGYLLLSAATTVCAVLLERTLREVNPAFFALAKLPEGVVLGVATAWALLALKHELHKRASFILLVVCFLVTVLNGIMLITGSAQPTEASSLSYVSLWLPVPTLMWALGLGVWGLFLRRRYV